MKKFIYIIILCVAALSTSCDKWPENGDLDGQWQLTELTPAGEDTQNVRSQGIYWNVQLNLLVIHTTREPLNGRTFNTSVLFERKGSVLRLTALYIHDFSSDELVTDPDTTAFEWTGIYGNQAEFHIERLDDHRMVLVSDRATLRFRKLG